MLKRIKELRESGGISQKNLGDVIGMSQQSVNAYENRDIEPDIKALIAIADYFSTSVDYVVGHSDIYRRIETVSDFELNKQEGEHITNYRKLNDNSQRIIDELILELINKK